MKPIVTLSIALVALLQLSCNKKEVVKPEPPKPRPVITFTVKEPVKTIDKTYSGLTKSANTASLGFEISGRIIELNAKQGQRYDKGAVIAKVDVSTYEAAVRQAHNAHSGA